MKYNSEGFTVVELLIGILMLSVISLSIYGVYSMTERLYKSTVRLQSLELTASRIVNELSLDVGSTIDRSRVNVDESGKELKLLSTFVDTVQSCGLPQLREVSYSIMDQSDGSPGEVARLSISPDGIDSLSYAIPFNYCLRFQDRNCEIKENDDPLELILIIYRFGNNGLKSSSPFAEFHVGMF